jgi:phage terminase Nu1 subunit (DNA packaging protein)
MSEARNSPRLVNRAELASLCNVSLPTVDGWVRKGCPAIERGSKGREWRFDCAAVIDWRIARAVEAATAGLVGEDDKISKDEADRRRAVANAITAEVEANEALKSVVSRFDAESAIADFCQALRSGFSNAGAKIAGRAAMMTNPAEIRDLCEAEFNRSFEAAEKDLAERWRSDGDAGGGDLDTD